MPRNCPYDQALRYVSESTLRRIAVASRGKSQPWRNWPKRGVPWEIVARGLIERLATSDRDAELDKAIALLREIRQSQNGNHWLGIMVNLDAIAARTSSQAPRRRLKRGS
jgi:hypothetical protein